MLLVTLKVTLLNMLRHRITSQSCAVSPIGLCGWWNVMEGDESSNVRTNSNQYTTRVFEDRYTRHHATARRVNRTRHLMHARGSFIECDPAVTHSLHVHGDILTADSWSGHKNAQPPDTQPIGGWWEQSLRNCSKKWQGRF